MKRRVYSQFIDRPPNTLYLPTEIKRSIFDKSINPLDKNSAAKFQKWCSENTAMRYYSMRPILQPDEYNNLLILLFKTIIGNNKFIFSESPIFNRSEMYCPELKKAIMNFIMKKIAEAVKSIPDFNKNSTYISEQFHWTDAIIFNYGLPSTYEIQFNLFNALRSNSDIVNVIIQNEKIVKMEFATKFPKVVNNDDIFSNSTNGLITNVTTNITNVGRLPKGLESKLKNYKGDGLLKCSNTTYI